MSWLLVVSAAASHAEDPTITVRDARIATAPPTVAINAGYLTIDNRGENERILESVTSPAFERVEMHRSRIGTDGTAAMRRQDRIAIPAGERIEFKPGGYHLMLFNPHEPARAGREISLILHFADGLESNVTAAVRRLDGSHGSH